MRIYALSCRYAVLALIAGTSMFPLISRAFFSEDIKKIHTNSEELREERREQFRQDVLQKRKEFFTKWSGRKNDFKDKLKQEREQIQAEFEIHTIEEIASTSDASGTPMREATHRGNLWSAIMRTTLHFFLPLNHLFGGNE